MSKKFIIFSTLLLLTHSAAYAEESAYSNFSGLYIGGSIGGVIADSKSVEKDNGERTGFTNKNEPQGFKVGGLVGYNYVTPNNILLGLEANFDFYDADDDAIDKKPPTVNVNDTFVTESTLKQKAALKARIGYL